MDYLRIGFIGAGLVAHGHALSLRSISLDGGMEGRLPVILSKVYDLDFDKAKIFAEQHQLEQAVSDPEEVLQDPLIDAVYICTPTASHKQYFLQAAANGKHIFVEKPLAFSTADIREMISSSNKAGIQAQVGLVLRFEPVFWYIKGLLEKRQEQLGKPVNFILRSDQEWPLTGSFHNSSWRSDPLQAFAGCLFEHSIHDVDLIRYLFGNPIAVSGFVGYNSPYGAGKIEDTVTINFQFEQNLAGNLTSIYHHIKDRDVRRMEIFCERAAILLDDFKTGGFGKRYRTLELHLSGKKTEAVALEDIDAAYLKYLNFPELNLPHIVSAYRYQALSFIRSLLQKKPIFPGLEVGMKAHQVIEMIYEEALTR